ncbi:hypothetical protein acsn021_10740 [Anaerocolumna cellulosilytica]|uniref:Uncharacterized protein n=1 Tax=Anaerocolumna cellulosilytica TaxID=433286 RepID=A0A6S6R1S3_9FIRM|nr:hypothetical protein [Anaerocolumna cellulosilytica]MBB5194561.1 hypothetical protein [Anaerocolumna cellulosilytica]BCJ93505.1 hypothetical protein acsn021_10740 [Anaerocolumna cellulosilytica]
MIQRKSKMNERKPRENLLQFASIKLQKLLIKSLILLLLWQYCSLSALHGQNMNNYKDSKGTPSKDTGAKDKINLDYDFNTEYGDGDIPDIDKPGNNTKNNESPV